MIANNTLYPDLIVLDVRTQSEYDANHLCNAILIPSTELESRINEVMPYNDTEIIVYCQSGFRSAGASQTLVDHGFTKVFNMLGGISGWISAGYEVCPLGNGQPIISYSMNLFLIIFIGCTLIFIIFLKRKILKKKKILNQNLL
jgi:rhodanese-related sulfurtransferase